jgi:hypothetical protein
MDYADIIKAIETASTFDLYRLQVAIGHLLEEPQRLKAIKRRLKPGQEITYFDRDENRLVAARIIKLKQTRLLVERRDNQERWDIPFYWVNLENVETDPSPSPNQVGLAKSQVRVGDRVGFEARAGDLLYGEVIRLNRKTVTLEVEGEGQWRVAYSLLFPVIEGQEARPKLIDGKSSSSAHHRLTP